MSRIIPFTNDQEKYINNNWLKIPLKRMAETLKIHPGRIERYLKRNNMEKPQSVIDKFKKESQFSKKHTPFNKGKKQSDYMSVENIEKTKKTRFKKGNKPHNTKQDGFIVERKETDGKIYKYIRVSLGQWELYHRYLWEKEYGKIKEGYTLTFKDGNSLNTDLKNLEQISRAELMLKNSKHNYPSEVIPTMLIMNEIKNKLEKLEENGK